MFDIIGTVFPMLVIFLLLRGILQTVLRSGRRQWPEQADDGEYGEEKEQEAAQPVRRPDLAAEFERRLKKTSNNNAVAKAKTAARTDKQRVHRDNEVLVHDKGKVYYDPRGDYSYNEERFNAQAAAFRSRYAAKQEAPLKPRLQLKHSALVQGFIMSQVLEKPRSLNPYGTEEQL
mgnify:CR=1 FL=1